MNVDEAIAAVEEFGRVAEKMAREAEAELEARGIKRDPHIPALDQLALVEMGEGA